MAKASYSKPTSQLDLEERSKKDYVPPAVLSQGQNPQLSDDGFVGGVDPEYRNYSDVAFKPFVGEKGPEAEMEKAQLAEDVDNEKGATPSGIEDSGSGEKKDKSKA